MKCNVEGSDESDKLNKALSRFWDAESIWTSKDNVINQFEKDIYHNGTRYVTKLPFKPDCYPLPDNFTVCENRLKSLKRRLTGKEIFKDYNEIFKEYEVNNIIESAL